ncbi:zinc finger CCCH domain-containing protein 54 [Durio zibethinus]|uniref:Zinc finger CCCH domain-containing protein 54 n=1 Tax=Durio zibethinus TaxID=66656 RepID=A0A6P5YCR7_DURZI|nr:zinc finger CCCH domain-containing protein 54 [Durio zibethinus]
MLKGVNPNNFYDFAEQQFISGLNITQAQYNDAIDEAIYGSDEFRMYAYKIKRCTRMRSHDWTECPYAHRGEKAQRRDPRKVPYTAIACHAFRNGKCHKGDACEFAHGVFEYWLHPARYRTRACNAGRFCQRKVCFFAHTPDQLRSESKYKCHFAYKGRMMNCGDHQLMVGSPSSGGEGSTSMQPGHVAPSSPFSPMMNRESCSCEGVSDFLKSLRALKIREDEERERNNIGGGFEVADSDLPHLDWISELLK